MAAWRGPWRRVMDWWHRRQARRQARRAALALERVEAERDQREILRRQHEIRQAQERGRVRMLELRAALATHGRSEMPAGHASQEGAT